MKKCLKFFYAFLLTLLFASCSWFNNDPVQPLPVIPQFNTFTITGNLTTNGAMPENFARALNSRTALATAPEGQTIQYKVLLLAAEGAANPITGASSESDGTSYTIKYTGTSTTAAQYWLRAVAYYMNGTDEVVILSSPDTQLETAVDLKGGVFTKDLEMRPATSGYGEVELDITLASATMCDSITISDDTHFEITGTGTDRKIVHKATSAENPKVACGSYPVTVSFYKTVSGLSTPLLVYQFEDIINVFNNLTTNKWVDNGNSPHLTTESGVTSCSITSAKLTDFNKTNLYVDKLYEGDFLGTYQQPYHTLKDAITLIEQTGNSNTIYTIHVKEVASSDNFDEEITSIIQINKKIKIEVYKQTSAPGSKDGYYLLKSTSSSAFRISSGALLVFESNGAALERSGLPAQGTKGIVITEGNQGVYVSGKFVMKGGLITGCTDQGVCLNISGSEKTFEMYGGAITANSGKGLRVPAGTAFVIKGKPYIYGNTDYNLRLNNGCVMTVAGRLQEGALIGIVTETPPTLVLPVTITSGYGYQTGGYNAGQLPGKYFRGDRYGVTEDGDPDSGEAVLKLGGGNITTKVRDDITIDIDHTNASKNTADKVFTFTVTKDKGAVAPATSTDLTSATGVSYEYSLKDHSDNIISPTYYSKNANTVTLQQNFPDGRYTLNATVTYEGNKYTSSFEITFVNTNVPSGCVAVLGSTWNSSTTLCAGDADRQSNLFIAGRHLDIPDIIASDHEVTQTEWEQYMTYDPDLPASNKPSETGTDKDKYPVYFVDWYATIIYCNLRTLGDSTFGSTREERLTHCVYSLNGTKDPELWLNSLISGTRICKTADNKFYYEYYYKYTPSSSQTSTTVLDTTATSGYQFDLNADGWRLPTAVEREYLARGGNLLPENQTIYSGTDSLEDVTATSGTIEIKQTIPNNLKLYDMSSNLKEWLWDRTNDALDVQSNTPITGKMAGNKRCKSMPQINWHQPTFPNRGYQYDEIGFRVIRTVK